MARKKKSKKTTETTTDADVVVADMVETTAEMDAAIETAEDLAEQVHDEIQKAELTGEEAEIAGALQATGCWMTMISGKEINISGPDASTVKDGSAAVWRVLGRLRREKKIESYPTVNTEVAKK